jgi:hypothetical protein
MLSLVFTYEGNSILTLHLMGLSIIERVPPLLDYIFSRAKVKMQLRLVKSPIPPMLNREIKIPLEKLIL